MKVCPDLYYFHNLKLYCQRECCTLNGTVCPMHSPEFQKKFLTWLLDVEAPRITQMTPKLTDYSFFMKWKIEKLVSVVGAEEKP